MFNGGSRGAAGANFFANRRRESLEAFARDGGEVLTDIVNAGQP
jgi:hypothetical protein